MLNRIPLILLATGISLSTRAQPKPATPAAGGGAGASAPTSNNAQTGYVYYLKYQKHIQYASTSCDTFYLTINQLQKNGTAKIFDERVEPGKLITAQAVLDRMPNPNLTPGRINVLDYELRSFKKSISCLDDPICKYTDPGDDTVLMVQVFYNDSIPRYWPVARLGPFSMFRRARLRLGINQDSAMLSGRIFYDDFEDAIEPHVYEVTNSNYLGKNNSPAGSEARSFAEYLDQRNTLIKYRNIRIENDETLEQADGFFQEAVKDASKPGARPGNYATLVEKFNDVVAAYEKDMKILYPKGWPKISRRKARKREKVQEAAYSTVYNDYIQVKKSADGLLQDRKINLNNIREALPSLKPDAQVKAQVDFLFGLYDLKAALKPALPGLPLNTCGLKIPEKAIPVNGNDTVANFYFKIIHKGTIHQRIYYLPLHYGVNDYGTTTIPFRYRLPQSNQSLLAQAGSPATATVPEESDANLSIATYFGRKWGRTRFYEDPAMTHNTFSIEIAGFTGPTLVPLSVSNVANTSRYFNDSSIYVGPANIIAWSAGAGGVIEWKTINFGVFGGWDFPLITKSGWVYARQFWFGFGIGVNLGIFSSGNAVY